MKWIARMLIVLALGVLAIPAVAQEWTVANQITVAWDAVVVPSGTVSYKVYTRPVAGGQETLATTVTATEATVTFTVEGRYFLGVRGVRNVDGLEIESSTIQWSDNPVAVLNGVTFGAQYYVPPGLIQVLRIKK